MTRRLGPADRLHGLVRASTLLVLTLVCGLVDTPLAYGQILNTLRGRPASELGWSGSAEGAVSVADGNSEYTEIELGLSIQRRSEHQRWWALGRAMWRTASGDEVAESRVGHLRHNYRLTSWLATVAFVQGQHDPFRRLQTRLLVGAGARFDIFTRPDWQTSIGTTIMREDQRLTDPGDADVSNDDTTHRFSFFLSMLREVEEGLDIDVLAFFQPRVRDFRDSRAFAAARLRVDLVGALFLSLRYGLEYDTRPPDRVQRADHSLRSGLGYDF